MTSRRGFLAGLLATGLAPQASWADLGCPAYLSAAKQPDGTYTFVGLSAQGTILFRCPLPDRGHAASAHPKRPEVVAFARRPGRFADVIDCRTGNQLARITPTKGHHFYGHGCFSHDGSQLFTTENEYETARGIIGVWDTTDNYRRIGSFASGGIGPHDVLLHQKVGGLVVANGGIQTHPDRGREKLNLDSMQPNLTYLDFDGTVIDQMQLSDDLHQNSIRHLSMHDNGTVGFAMQWQGEPGADVPIVGLHRPGTSPRLLAEDDPRVRNLNGYGGSIQFSADGSTIAVTSPRGGVVQVMDTASGLLQQEHHLADVCGLSTNETGFVASTGAGQLVALNKGKMTVMSKTDLRWDNHLIRLR
ncbi:DUF1513 domain-containing protein [Sedimentitalea sp. CY04]|uniref:DUF1513 domain-containing protein n=1 Tax=Parasedimentitalea denitrificans TaxID=2211118 RepID=A0ABX0W2G8_9RHOB|nr:DUF1513 domain-containing protein [Sedimentitalea sp. CY04]NIZ59677.1 DUF1513 domain-containing protein [Sedimentitalea sp. CY04]